VNKNNTLKTQMIGNMSWLFMDKIIKILGGIFVGIWVARYLGPEDFGALNYALAYISFFLILTNLGLEQIVIREILKSPMRTKYLLGTVFTLKLIGSLCAVILVFLSFLFIKTDHFVSILIIILAMGFIAQSFDTVDYFFQSKILAKNIIIARSAAFTISLLMKIYFIVGDYSVVYFAIAITIDMYLSALFLFLMYKKSALLSSRWVFSKIIAKRLLVFCWPIALSVFLISIHTKVDQIMIGKILGLADVGVYVVALRISELFYFIPAIVVSTFLPYLLNLKKINPNLYADRLLQLYSAMFWLGIAFSLFSICYGKLIISYLFGGAYSDAYKALVYSVWSGVFIGQATVRGILIINDNSQKYRLYNNFIMMIMNIVANIFLIDLMGISGAALATLLTQFIGTWLLSLIWKPLRQSTWNMMKAINPKYLIVKQLS